MTIHMKATGQYFPVVLLFMLYKVPLTLILLMTSQSVRSTRDSRKKENTSVCPKTAVVSTGLSRMRQRLRGRKWFPLFSGNGNKDR